MIMIAKPPAAMPTMPVMPIYLLLSLLSFSSFRLWFGNEEASLSEVMVMERAMQRYVSANWTVSDSE